jgi:hypothetical protein
MDFRGILTRLVVGGTIAGLLLAAPAAADAPLAADALPDGFPSADALRAEIAALYPNELAAGHRAYRVRFRLLPPEQWPAKARKKRRPADSAEDAVE